MRSTGEVMGVGTTFGLAFAKSQIAAGTRLPDSGTVFLSLADRDKEAGVAVARALSDLGFTLVATAGTAAFLRRRGLPVAAEVAKVGEPAEVAEVGELAEVATAGELVEMGKVGELAEVATSRADRRSATEGEPGQVLTVGGAGEAVALDDPARVAIDAVELIESGAVHLVINTPRGRGPRADGIHIRTAALAAQVPCLTTLAAARAAAAGIADWRSHPLRVTSLQVLHRSVEEPEPELPAR